MAYLSKQVAITYDDVLIKPRYSNITTRQSIDTSVNFLGLKLATPIISANMDSITDIEMAEAIFKAGGLGILHRFMEKDLLLAKIKYLRAKKLPIAFSVGTRTPADSINLIDEVVAFANQPIYVTIDVAHGHHNSVASLVNYLRKIPNVYIIAGNVATAAGYDFLSLAGAHAVKVGIGPGAACTTREVTGIGVPQLTALMEITERDISKGPLIIADGGIKNSGDIVKALAAGADVVMLGSLLAGCPETPQEPRSGPQGQKWYQYRGQSTIGSNKEKYAPEGVSGWVQEKPPVAEVIHTLTSGLRSGMSYVGARNLEELKQDVEFIRVSPSTRLESDTRVTLSI